MSLIRRKAIVNYHGSSIGIDGTYSCYDDSKILSCDIFGKVTENIVEDWERYLTEYESKCPDNPIKSIGVRVTSFTKLDV